MNKDKIVLGIPYLTTRDTIAIPTDISYHGAAYNKYEGIIITGNSINTTDSLDSDYFLKEIKTTEDIPQLKHYPSYSIQFSKSNVILMGKKVVLTKGIQSIADFMKEFIVNEKESLNLGKNIKVKEVSNIILDGINPDDIIIEPTIGDIHAKYEAVVNAISSSMEKINEMDILAHQKEIAEAFIKTKAQVTELATQKPGKIGFFKRLAKEYLPDKLVDNIKEEFNKAQSTQENINKLFGMIYSKYENLVKTGENLQKAKAQIVKQLEILKDLHKESEETLSQYQNEADKPIRDLSTNTKIKTAIAKYHKRLSKIDAAIIGTQSTIMALAKDLPSHKADLTEELAIGSLLSNVDDYQQMYSEVVELVSTVTEVVEEKTHTSIENLMEIQLRDTKMMDYLEKSGERHKKFVKMFQEKSGLLATKLRQDHQRATALVRTTEIGYTDVSKSQFIELK